MSDRAPAAGLLQRDGTPVPLRGVTVEGELRDLAARVVVTQRFRNDERVPIEAVYVFPVDEAAAVCGFEAVIDGVHVVAEVRPRDEAFERYDDAMAAGHGAYLLDQEQPDVFTASIGNLPPGAEVLVRITYVTELSREGERLRFVLPTTVSPRYAPEQDRTGVGRPPSEALNPPVAWTVPYGLALTLTLDMPAAIRGIESPSHTLAVESDGARASVRLSGRAQALDRDFVLLVALAATEGARVVLERTPDGQHALLAVFEPSFEAQAAPCEAVFVVDRSGSMEGSSIAEARNALQLCLRSLSPGSYFNVVSFGNGHELLFPQSRAYDEASLSAGRDYVTAMDADMGGTEMLPALEAAFALERHGRLARQVFVLTDGQVTNTAEVITLVRRHAGTARLFAFGIGHGPSRQLIRGMARAGGGAAEFIAPGERIEAKVLRQFARALAPGLVDPTVDWGTLGARQAPHRLPAVFAGEPLRVYALLDSAAPADIRLTAQDAAGERTWTVRLDHASAVLGTVVTTLAARGLIRDLEEGSSPWHQREGSQQARGAKRVEAEIVALATRHHLASKATSFVAVERREAPSEARAELRRIPVALTRGWGGEDRPRVLHSMPTGAMFSAGRAMPASAPMAARPASAPALPAAARFMKRAAGKLRRSMEELPAAYDRSPAAPAPSLRALDRVVALQRADGSWKATDELARLLGVTWSDLRARSGDAVPRLEEKRALLQEQREQLRKDVARAHPGDAGQRAGLERRLADVEADLQRLETELSTARASADPRTQATAATLQWLEAANADSRDEWSLLAAKAARFVGTTLQG